QSPSSRAKLRAPMRRSTSSVPRFARTDMWSTLAQLAVRDQAGCEHASRMNLWLLPALLLLIAIAAPRYGVDSRDGHDWNRRFGPPDPPPPMASRRRSTPAADLAALARF